MVASPQPRSFRHLDAITHDLVAQFLSRNNDLDGYWAIGVMVMAGPGTGTIDLLRGEGHGLLRRPELRAVVDATVMRFNSQASAQRIDRSAIADARMVVEIASDTRPSRRCDGAVEFRVTCTCAILDARNRSHHGSGRVWASAHDPTVDVRSARHPAGS